MLSSCGCYCELRTEILRDYEISPRVANRLTVWLSVTAGGKSRVSCGLAEGCIGYLQCMMFDSP